MSKYKSVDKKKSKLHKGVSSSFSLKEPVFSFWLLFIWIDACLIKIFIFHRLHAGISSGLQEKKKICVEGYQDQSKEKISLYKSLKIFPLFSKGSSHGSCSTCRWSSTGDRSRQGRPHWDRQSHVPAVLVPPPSILKDLIPNISRLASIIRIRQEDRWDATQHAGK